MRPLRTRRVDQPSVAVAPGGTHDFDLWLRECCYTLEPVEVCAEWSLDPTDGATLDQDGVLKVDAATAVGTTYTITADIEDGRRIMTIDAVVTTPTANPLLGNWHEAAQIPCDGGPEIAPAQPIGELAFFAGGEINVTWTPFEVYVDYWGHYELDLDAGTLTFGGIGGNYVPTDIDGEGRLELKDGDLLLEDMWLGSPQGATTKYVLPGPRCLRPSLYEVASSELPDDRADDGVAHGVRAARELRVLGLAHQRF